jgi:hypothetical protein
LLIEEKRQRAEVERKEALKREKERVEKELRDMAYEETRQRELDARLREIAHMQHEDIRSLIKRRLDEEVCKHPFSSPSLPFPSSFSFFLA